MPTHVYLQRSLHHGRMQYAEIPDRNEARAYPTLNFALASALSRLLRERPARAADIAGN